MLIFDKELKALPAAGDRNPGVTFSVTLQGTIFAGSPGSPPPPAPHPRSLGSFWPNLFSKMLLPWSHGVKGEGTGTAEKDRMGTGWLQERLGWPLGVGRWGS